MNTIHDMHCHLDFMVNGEEVAADAQAAGSRLFANTVTPDGWEAACATFAPYRSVTVGFGMHPWWVSSETVVEDVLERLADHQPRVIGEVGLDFGKRHVATASEQREIFEGIAQWCAQRGGRLISLHSVHASGETLDILEQFGALESCTCVFHWFTGPSDQLKRAIQANCYFSVGLRMLATGKGREYVKAIPAERLLFETDAPPEQGKPYSFELMRRDLEDVARKVAAIKGDSLPELAARTSCDLLNGAVVLQ